MENLMSSLINPRDQVPWQRLGAELDHPSTAEEAIISSGLGYEVQKRKLRAVLKRREQIEVPNHFATVRMDTGRVLGVVGNRYEVVQNTESFRFFDPLVSRDEAIYETAGVIDGGRSMWLLAKLPGYIRIGKRGDLVSKYVLLVNAHDGSSQVRCKLTAIRVVCKNSLSTALAGSDQEVKIRHTAQAPVRLEEAHQMLGLWNSLYQQLEYIFNTMALKRFTSKQLQEYVEKLIPSNQNAESNVRTNNQRSRILELAETGIGADIHRGSVFSAYNAVTEYVDHQDAKDPAKHLKSIWFGQGNKLKQQAFSLAEDYLKN
jgi:phage/plasmid-like protein (TIGR03299 family)